MKGVYATITYKNVKKTRYYRKINGQKNVTRYESLNFYV